MAKKNSDSICETTPHRTLTQVLLCGYCCRWVGVTSHLPPSEEMLHTLFIAQVEAYANDIAVIAPDRTLTYWELYEQATEVARWGLQAIAPERFELVQRPTDLAVVIYTSGSTGLPKGVIINHRGAVNTVLDINRRFKVTQHDRVLALSALNFELSVVDIFALLAVGGTIVMPAQEGRCDPAHWAELMEQHGVTLWDTGPALMQMLVEYQGERAVDAPWRLVMMSGDWIGLNLPERQIGEEHR